MATTPRFPPGLPIPRIEPSKPDTLPELPLPTNSRSLISSHSPPSPSSFHPGFRIKKSRDKNSPIVSCGVICFQIRDNTQYVLLIRRKDSLGYVEFIRGKYNPSDLFYIRELIDSMTFEERHRILTTEFSELWKQMWISRSFKRHRNEYLKSLHRFDSIKEHIRKYIADNPTKGWEEPEWGFPKGRPNKDESPKHCAMREFREETGIHTRFLEIVDSPEYEEDYTGTNGIMYQNKYLIGKCELTDVGVIPGNKHQAKEISDVRWIPVKDVERYIRKTYPSRLIILENASQWFLEHYD